MTDPAVEPTGRCFGLDRPDGARPGDVLRIAVVGGESSGKSTLVAALRERFDEPSVAEYGRTLYEQRDGRLVEADLLAIAIVHVGHEDAAFAAARRLVLVDTTPLTTLWYALDGYGAADPALVALSWRPYDLVLVCAPDFAFVDDGFRASDDFRMRHDRWLRATLAARGIAFVAIAGPRATRVDTAVAAIERVVRAR